MDVDAFAIDRYNVTNAAFLEFVDAGGYTQQDWWTPEDWAWINESRQRHPSFWTQRGNDWFWRGMFEEIPLPASWPVYVSHAEARAFARWRGRRLPTEAEYQRAAYGAPRDERRQYPWGDDEPDGDARRVRLLELGAAAGGIAPSGPIGVGRRRSRRQRLGMDLVDLPPVPGICRQPVVSRDTPLTSSTNRTT